MLRESCGGKKAVKDKEVKNIQNNGIVSAKEWILNSGIQNTEGVRSGGFNSWYDMDEKGYSYVYSEITGYGITTLLYLSERFGDEGCLQKAIKAANWLTSKALHPAGGVKTRDYFWDMKGTDHYSFDSQNIYAFDNGMVLYGIANLYKKTESEEYLKFAQDIADFLLKDMMMSDGLFYAVFDGKTGEKLDEPWKWSSQSGSYHAKLALGFTDLFDITKDEKYKDAVLALCQRSLAFQEDSGRFITSRADGSTHLHPHSYSAEGLLYAGVYFDEEEFVNSALKAVIWSLEGQLADGGIPKKFESGNFIPFYRSDILAQTLRLGVLLRAFGKLDKKYDTYLEKLHKRLLSFQYFGQEEQSGGFFYGTSLDGIERTHLNSWCTMFAFQALGFYDDIYLTNSKVDKLEHFI